jgi:hypothetical protein
MSNNCEGCALQVDWCYVYYNQTDDYKQDCPCKLCIIKPNCSKQCENRKEFARRARLDYVQKISG